MRATRVIYVEDDPALQGIMTTLLTCREELDVLLSTTSPTVVLEDRRCVEEADVALIDLVLGSAELNGIDLGLALRARNPHIGIVIHSQHPMSRIERRIPQRQRMGWSTVPKTGDLDLDSLVGVLRTTAQGMSSRVPQESTHTVSPLTVMTARQRAIMSLAASGVSTTEIARRLIISQDAVRQDLSKCYRILIPESSAADDLRTLAIFAYLSMVNGEDEGNDAGA